ncbi:alanine racemase [Streptomyces sp. NPDC093097]
MDRETSSAAARTHGLPELRLDLGALEDNVRIMAGWCREQGVELCPHIKTTMTRPIVQRQIDAGAWGVTVATAGQARTAVGWGIRRVVIANEVVHSCDLALLRQLLEAVPELELYCFIDSVTGLGLARQAMEGTRNPLRVLVDVGTHGGRSGAREPAQAYALGAAVYAESGLLLAGVGGYEGVRPNLRDSATLSDVDEHCRKAAGVFHSLIPLFQTAQPVFSMGGSAFPDRVVRAFASLGGRPGSLPAVPVLRSGCYVTHDHGTYEHVSPVPGLRAALTVRAVVLSTPEPGLAVVGAGRRELPYDAGLPVLVGARSPQGIRRQDAKATAAQIFDHHLVLTDAHGLHVGDEVDLGISHPCSAFDRWPQFTVVDADGNPQDIWHTQFH